MGPKAGNECIKGYVAAQGVVMSERQASHPRNVKSILHRAVAPASLWPILLGEY